MVIHALAASPPTLGTSWAERQEGPDRGLISAWLRGLEWRTERATYEGRAAGAELAAAALAGELPVLPFKGGVERAIKGEKFGAYQYLAMWQGLRGQDLWVELDLDTRLTCSRTGVTVVYTSSLDKLKAAS